MRFLLFLMVVAFLLMFLVEYLEKDKHPYEIGIHNNYEISCENGYVYKILSDRRGTIQILNKNGKPKTCEELKKEIEIWKANKK